MDYSKDIKNFSHCLHSTCVAPPARYTCPISQNIRLSSLPAKYELLFFQHLSPSLQQCNLLFSKCSVLACVFALLFHLPGVSILFLSLWLLFAIIPSLQSPRHPKLLYLYFLCWFFNTQPRLHCAPLTPPAMTLLCNIF